MQLLGRVFNILRENNPELAGDRRRTVMRPPQVLREGTKKTVFVNFMDLCKTYVTVFFPVFSTLSAIDTVFSLFGMIEDLIYLLRAIFKFWIFCYLFYKIILRASLGSNGKIALL